MVKKYAPAKPLIVALELTEVMRLANGDDCGDIVATIDTILPNPPQAYALCSRDETAIETALKMEMGALSAGICVFSDALLEIAAEKRKSLKEMWGVIGFGCSASVAEKVKEVKALYRT